MRPPRGAAGRSVLAAALAAWAGVGCVRNAAERPLRVALPYEIHSLDPHLADTTAAYAVLGNVYDGLVAADPGLGLRPRLARRWHNADPLTWEFELDPAARFHGGRPVLAEDAAYSINRVLGRTDLEVRYYLGDVATARSVGLRSLRLELKRRSPVLLNKLSHVFVVPAGSDDAALAAATLGSGPYRVSRFEAGRLVELQGVAGTRPLPPARRVEMHLGVGPEATAEGLASGALDVGMLGRADPAGLASTGFGLHRRASLQVMYLSFDLVRRETPFVPGRPNPFRDRRVREAIDLALDRPALVARLPGRARPANQIVPRHVFGFNERLPEPRVDRARARELLREAGLERGLRSTLHTRSILRQAAEGVRDQLGEVGIALELAVLPDAEYFAALRGRRMSAWLDRWVCTTGDAAELFENAFHTPDPAKGLGAFNETGYGTPELDAAIEAALAIEDLNRRRAALADLLARLAEAQLTTPLYTDEELWAVAPDFRWRPRSNYWLRLEEIEPAE